ncbi:MAG: peptidoglycan-N-acetylglucosamine deacetylase [Chloroflexota bacterium]|jgi:peptidoglycan/xylan/chitin deacetylase (PgdA/CDA1 family)|nr:peptidoglycan-N-acetylglucosamine deacetylase [Chloroflexota bacterium]
MTEPRIALTFDAEHPDRPRCRPGVQEELLDVLDRLAVRATFFIQGRWAEAYPRTARRIAEAGHLVGSHSFYHARLPLLTDAGLRTDIQAAAEAIGRIAGVSPAPWFRCPFGAGHDDPRVIAAIRTEGYRNVHWDVWAEDWEPGRTGAQIERQVSHDALAQGDGTVVLLHTWPEPTLEALPGLVARLRDAGAVLVTVDQLPSDLTILGEAPVAAA